MNVRSMDVKLPRLGLGTWSFAGDVWGPQEDADSTAAVVEALDQGCSLIDTALSYGSGRSERIVGAAVKSKRDDVQIVTKVPPRNEVWGPPSEQAIIDAYDANWIQGCCEQSLRNLATDRIDVLLLHTWNREWPVDGEWRDALETLKKAGKIRGYGISVDDLGAEDANEAMTVGLNTVELVYNVVYQQAAQETLPKAAATNTAVIGRAPLQAGLLSGKYQERGFPVGDWRAEWTSQDWLEWNRAMVHKVAVIADDAGMSTTELSLRFALSQPRLDAVVVGSRSREQVATNFDIAARGPLNPDLISRLVALWRSGAVRGTYLGSS